MTVRELVQRAVAAELGRVADRLAKQAPHPGLRPSIVPPTPDQVEAARRRITQEQRIGQPDIHTGYPEHRRAYLR
jgi:hypothetical protein